jgi:Zn-dependent metalloprotease
MNSKFLLILLASALALPQNDNVVAGSKGEIQSTQASTQKKVCKPRNHDSVAQGKDAHPDSNGLVAGKKYVLDKFGYKDGVDYKVTSSYSSSNGITHIYLAQLINGLEVDNSSMNLNVDSKGDVISVGGSFTKPTLSKNNSEDWGSAVCAVFSLFDHLKVNPEVTQNEVKSVNGADGNTFILSNIKASSGNVTVTKKYIQDEKGETQKAWTFEIDLGDHYWSAAVSPSGKVIKLNDLTDSNHDKLK